MAISPCGLVPSDPIFVEVPLRYKLGVFQAPKFGYRASTPKSYAFRGILASSKQNNPPTVTSSSTKTIPHHGFSSENDMEVRHCLPKSDCIGPDSDSRQIKAQAMEVNAFKTNDLAGSKRRLYSSKNKFSSPNARNTFAKFPKRTGLPYAALMRSYCRLERWEEFFTVLNLMIGEGILPDKYLVPTILKACSSLQMLKEGKMIHGYVFRRKELESDVFIGNALIDFYSNCENLRSCLHVFDAMKVRDVVSWTALVSAYMNEGLSDKAMEIFKSMQLNGVEPDLISWNALTSGFARNGETALALQCLEDMRGKGLQPQVNSWNGIISGYVQNGFFEDALHVLHDMLCFCKEPNSVTIASILPACAGLKDLSLGRAVHGYVTKHELGRNYHVELSLIDMYSKCQKIDYAEKVFREAVDKNTAVWNGMIAAYVDEGNMEKALELRRLMQNEGLKPDLITYNILLAGHARYRQKNEIFKLLSEMSQIALEPTIISWNVLISGFQQSGLSYEALKVFQNLQSDVCSPIFSGSAKANAITISSALSAFADLHLWRQGKEIHAYALRNGFESNIYVSNALIDMYMKSEDVESANETFRRTVDRNTITWNNMMTGYLKKGQLEMALKLLSEMLIEGHKPSAITFLILLPACGELAAPRLGRQLLAYIVKNPFRELNDKLASALEEMYAMSGCTVRSKRGINSG